MMEGSAMSLINHKATRRQFLGGTAVGLGSLVGAVSAGPAQRAVAAAPSEPLHFIGWGYHPELVQSNVQKFQELYDENVQYELISDYASYPATLETRFIGGFRPDMLYAETSYMYRWLKAKFVQDVEGAKGLTHDPTWYRQNAYPANQDEMSIDGKWMGLAYYAGYISFIYNKELLDKANLKPATTWEELFTHCEQLQKDKISAHPFTMAWNKGAAGLTWASAAWFYSQGEYLFDEQNNPTFKDGGVAYKQVLEWMKMMFDKGYVPPDALVDPNEEVPAFGTGEIAYMLIHDYDQQSLNTDTKAFKTAPNKVENAIIPGETHTTYSWTPMLRMGAGRSGRRRERAWNRLQFFGGQAKDSQWHGNGTFALETGLGNPWVPLNTDAKILDAWSKWRNMDIHNTQLKQSKSREVEKTMWFPEWDTYFQDQVGNYIQGKGSVDDVIKNTYDKAIELKKQYGE
jgi:multiple sugar transport system substrate-binding protein